MPNLCRASAIIKPSLAQIANLRPNRAMERAKPDLSRAYALRTPDDSKQLYSEWADSYDQGFAQHMDYQLPAEVARLFVEFGGAGPVLDLGAGTGLCAEALMALGISPIDATDISPDMLDVAKGKGLYRHLFSGDLTDRLPVDDNQYAGLVSSGTFTTGHVGPEALDDVVRIAAPGALIAVSINAQHWRTNGFEEKFASLGTRIRELRLPEVHIYGPGNQTEHRDDTGLVALFRKS